MIYVFLIMVMVGGEPRVLTFDGGESMKTCNAELAKFKADVAKDKTLSHARGFCVELPPEPGPQT